MAAAAPVGPTTPLRQVRLAPAEYVATDATIGNAAAVMMRRGLTALLVEGAPLAILTERDVVAAVARGRSDAAPVRDAATPNPLAVRDDCTVIDATRAMIDEEVRHLVVVDADVRPVGILSLGIAARALLAGLSGPTWLSALKIALRVET